MTLSNDETYRCCGFCPIHVLGAARAVSLIMLGLSLLLCLLGIFDIFDWRFSLIYGLIPAIFYGLAAYGSHTQRRAFIVPAIVGIILFIAYLLLMFVLKIFGVQEARYHGFGYRQQYRFYGNRHGDGWGGRHHGEYDSDESRFNGGSPYNYNAQYPYDDRNTFDDFFSFFSIALGIFLMLWFLHVYIRCFRYLGLYSRGEEVKELRDVATTTGILRHKQVDV